MTEFRGSLEDVIDFTDFNYANWWDGEDKILKPQLESLGYTNIRFSPGETDTYGPLTRMCYADLNGARLEFCYG